MKLLNKHKRELITSLETLLDDLADLRAVIKQNGDDKYDDPCKNLNRQINKVIAKVENLNADKLKLHTTAECKYCKGVIYWLDGRAYNDNEATSNHVCDEYYAAKAFDVDVVIDEINTN